MLRSLTQQSAVVGCSILWVAVLFLAAGGCESPQSQTSEPILANTGKPALHAIQSDKLRDAMADLNYKASQSTRAELYAGPEAVELNTEKVAKAAATMAETARYIPTAIEELDLDEADRRVFIRIARKLQVEADSLEKAARSENVPAARQAMSRVRATCNACHTAFRLTPIDAM